MVVILSEMQYLCSNLITTSMPQWTPFFLWLEHFLNKYNIFNRNKNANFTVNFMLAEMNWPSVWVKHKILKCNENSITNTINLTSHYLWNSYEKCVYWNHPEIYVPCVTVDCWSESAGWENPTLRNTPAVQWLVASTERFHLRALLTLGDAIHTERKDHEEHYSVITVSVLSLSLKAVFSSLPVFHHSDNKLF